MSTPVAGANCLDKEALAAFKRGHLDVAVRRGVIEHMANCADCRIAISSSTDWDSITVNQAGRTRSRLAIRVAAMTACALLVLMMGRMASRVWTTDRGRLADAAAKLPVRRIAQRLTGGFVYRPLPSMRGEGIPKVDAGWELDAVRSRIVKAAAGTASVESLHTAGVSYLLSRHSSLALQQLEKALRLQTGIDDLPRAIGASRNAELLSDLSAAYGVRGETSRSWDLIAAVDAAIAAWNLQHTPEIAWNRALALEAMGLREDAQSAWRDYLQLDAESPWAAEARLHLQALLASTDVEEWDQLQKGIEGNSLDRVAMERAASAYPQYARAYIEEKVLPAWGAARIAGNDVLAARRLQAASALAVGIAANGDLLLRETVDTILKARASEVDTLARAHVQYGMAREHVDHGRYAEAVVSFMAAAAAFEQGGSPFALFTRLQLAVCSYARNHYAAVAAQLDRLAERISDRRYRSLSGRMIWVRALAREQMGNPNVAFAAYETALRTFSSLHEKDHEAALLTLMAETFHRTGEDDAAMEYHLRSIATIGRTGSLYRRHQVLFEAAFASIEQHRLFAAEVLIDRAMVTNRTATNPNNACVALVWRGVIHSMRGDEALAAADLREAEQFCAAIPDPAVRERITANFTLAAVAAREGKKPRSVVETTKAIAFFDATNSRLWLPQLLAERAAAYRGDGRLALAERDLQRGIEEVEAAEARARYPSSITGNAVASLYESMIAICLEQRRVSDALEYADRASERTVSALFGRAQQLNHDTVRKAVETGGGAAARVQALLPPDAVVANFFQLPDRLLIWTIRTHEIRLYEVPISATAFLKLTNRFSADPEGASSWPPKDAAAELSRLVLGSWIGEVRENETVIFTGEAAVRILPLAALTHPRGGYLMAHVPVATCTTLSRLATLLVADAARRDLDPKPLFVAASAPDRGVFPDLPLLPHSEAEVRISRRMYPSAVVLAGQEATKQAFLDASVDATLVHFGGHAVPNARAPLFSALIFSDGQGTGNSDEMLYMHEVSPSTFPSARLVVLAACSTAQQLRPNVSFAAALVEQQVPSVLSSIWDADDRAAAVFGTYFHSAVRRGASRAGALREAQLAMARSSDPSISHPAAWAGYQLLGAFGPIVDTEH